MWGREKIRIIGSNIGLRLVFDEKISMWGSQAAQDFQREISTCSGLKANECVSSQLATVECAVTGVAYSLDQKPHSLAF
jgi:hypothetical protein